MRIYKDAFDAFLPPPDEPMLHWCMRNVKTADDRQFDHFYSPHMGAPGGPMEAFQDWTVREIYLQMGTRSLKTTVFLMMAMYASAVQPVPVMFTSSDRKLVGDIVKDRIWPMIAKSSEMGKVPPPEKRSMYKVRLEKNRWDTGWAENPATLADKSVKVLLGNELPKWKHKRGTKEAHPWDLAKERCKEWADAKILGEGTPTVKGRCLIEREVQAGWNCQLFVPCPKCQKYQTLNFGSGELGSVRFDRAPSGRFDMRIAQRTARYVCRYCEAELRNNVRPWMMRRGVWVPEGCDVVHEAARDLFEGLEELPEGATHWNRPENDPRGPYKWLGWAGAPWIRGTPVKDGPTASYQMSSLYSVALGWGEMAAEYAKAMLFPATMRNFMNSWKAETYQEGRKVEEWEVVLGRVMRETPQGIVPRGFSTLALGVDKQEAHFVWHLVGAARPKRWATIDYGTAETLEEIFQEVLAAEWEHEDGGEKLYVRRAFVDTGYDPVDDAAATVHAWAREATRRLARLRRPLPQSVYGCKGNSKPIGMPYRLQPALGPGSACPGAKFYLVDPDFTHTIVDRGLYGTDPEKPDEAGNWQLFKKEPYEHEDFIRQMMNDAPNEVLDKKTREPYREWGRIDENIPNDYRAAGRYAVAAMLSHLRNGDVPARVEKMVAAGEVHRSEPAQGKRFTDPHGRPFCSLERR